MLVRVQMNFPATGEVLAPWAIGHFVAGGMRGSHHVTEKLSALERRRVTRLPAVALHAVSA